MVKKIVCPCLKCANRFNLPQNHVEDHLAQWGRGDGSFPVKKAVKKEETKEPEEAHGKSDWFNEPLNVVIFGATGDLARKKLFPAVYQLMLMGHLPKHTNVFGYGRKEVDMAAFLEKQCVNVKDDPKFPKSEFLKRVHFHAGGYDAAESYQRLDKTFQKLDGAKNGNRLYFLSIPPFIFGPVCTAINADCRAKGDAWTHLIIEKPFGRDSATFAELDACTSSLFKESELYRIDHYLGKEVVLNLMTLRFANQVFEAVWNKEHIESVEITFKEDLGTGGRGGYFDKFGIVRDIMQNHLLQVFMFLAMEPPKSMTAPDITAAKVELLKCVETLSLENGVFLGQFGKNSWNVGGKVHEEPGYLDDETVPAGSVCPTFAATVLRVKNKRWQGVPFLMKAGKGLDERMAEVRIHFKPKKYNKLMMSEPRGNELVMRIQPDEALYLKTFSKMPGLDQIVRPTVMDMKYASAFKGAYVGDAYERMFLNAAKGDGSLFVSAPELVESWRIFTPMLHEIDEKKPPAVIYPFGSRSPPGFPKWSQKQGVTQSDNWQEWVSMNADDCETLKSLFFTLDEDKSGYLDTTEVLKLARQFYDGREPTQKKVDEIVARLDVDGDGHITLDELLQGAQSFQRAFGVSDADLDP